MTVYEAVLARRTIRRFSQRPVEPSVLEKLVDAARLAPSGGNRQRWEFIVISDPSGTAAVFDTVAWAGYIAPRGIPPEGKRPTAYIVVLRPAGQDGISTADAAAAIENILLVAVEQGLGGCWIGSVKRDALAATLRVPAEFAIDSVVALGHPDERPVVEPFAGDIKYWKDEEGVLHVPKRSLRDVIHYGAFGAKTPSR